MIDHPGERVVSVLLPRPKRVNALGGPAIAAGGLRADVRVEDARVGSAAAEIAAICGRSEEGRAAGAGSVVSLSVGIGGGLAGEAYRLQIECGGIRLEGGSPAGCFWGLQTLRQLVAAAHEKPGLAASAVLPAVEIEDAPDFPVRGVLHDITRGRVPTLSTLKLLVDRAARLKLNEVHLYIEHAFAFSFDPDICSADSGILPDEARELSAYARERFVRVVPALANLGHMGRVLSMPKYAHLAEVPLRAAWEELPWPERLRGATLRSRDPEARELVAQMLGEVIEAFPGKTVNICGDEPWDIGLSRRDPLGSDEAKRAAYLDHVRFVSDLCARHGRRVQVWSDYLLGSGASGADLPGEATILHWGYDDDADYDATRRLSESGARVVVCPGTSSWKRVLPAMRPAERNVDRFVEAGASAGAAGVLMTDWGDHGHFHMPAGSAVGIAYAADRAWNAQGDGATDAALARQSLPLRAEDAVAGERLLGSLRRATDVGGGLETWRLFWSDRDVIRDEVQALDRNALDAAEEAAQSLADLLGSTASDGGIGAVDHAELLVASRYLEFTFEKLRFVRGEARGRTDDWADRVRTAAKDYSALWHLRNKPSDLADVLRAIERATSDLLRSNSA